MAGSVGGRGFRGGVRYSGDPRPCAAIVAAIDAMKDEGIIENAARIGTEVLGPGLRELAARHPVIGEVRGLAVFWALDLVSNRVTRAMLAPYGGSSEAMNEVMAQCRAGGVVPVIHYSQLHALPPRTVAQP